MNTATISARFGAVVLIDAVLMDKHMLGDAIAREDRPISRLAPPDRARAQIGGADPAAYAAA